MNTKIKKFILELPFQGLAFCFFVSSISNDSLFLFDMFLILIFSSLIAHKLRGFKRYQVYAMICMDSCLVCLGFYLTGSSVHNILWLLGSILAFYLYHLILMSFED
jgi:hypothetical protein